MEKEIHIADSSCRMNYVLYYPEEYRELPLMIYLHGAGERGLVYEHLYRHGIPRLIEEGQEYQAIVLCPQCPTHLVWNNVVEEVKALIDHVVERFSVKKDRVCITGSSMGGFGTFEMGLTYRNFFSAIAPVAGGGLSWRGANLRTTPVRAYHGDLDDAVPLVYSEMMVQNINNAGGNAELVVLQEYGHNDGIYHAYKDTDLTEWLLSARRTDYSYVPEVCEEFF